MILLQLLGRIVLVVGILLGVSLLAIVGRKRLRRLTRHLGQRVFDVFPYVGLVAIVLAINSVARDYGQNLSWMLDWNITGVIYSIEGSLVPQIQSFATPALTALFSYVYVYGYVFLLVFPILAYLALEDRKPLREAFLAYGFNYGVGVVCYVLFIAYGPRNLMPDLVDSLMYINWPQSQLLTSKINSNTNVFPSLHASMSMTVAVLAYRTRRTYPRWLLVSAPLAGLVMVATMYLGIHWGIDVAAGLLLGAASVAFAGRVTDSEGRNDYLERAGAKSVSMATGLYRLVRGRDDAVQSEATSSLRGGVDGSSGHIEQSNSTRTQPTEQADPVADEGRTRGASRHRDQHGDAHEETNPGAAREVHAAEDTGREEVSGDQVP
mgnify:CR=1 FL=1